MRLRVLFIFYVFFFYGGELHSQAKRRTGSILLRREELKTATVNQSNCDLDVVLPLSIDLSSKLPLPENQGTSNFCWAFSVSYLLSYILNEKKQDSYFYEKGANIKSRMISPLYIALKYINDSTKEVCEIGAKDFHVLENTMYKYGTCAYNDRPFNSICSIDSLPKRAVIRGYPNYFPELYIGMPKITCIKSLLSKGYPILATLILDDDFYYEEPKRWNKIPQYYDRDISTKGHSVLITGYNDTIEDGCFKFINSWGNSKGEGGYFWIGYDVFRTVCPQYCYIKNRISGATDIVKDTIDTTLSIISDSFLFSYWLKSGYYLDFKDFRIKLEYLNVNGEYSRISILNLKNETLFSNIYMDKGEIKDFYHDKNHYSIKFVSIENRGYNPLKKAMIFQIKKN